jgi:hypothetical protein
MPSTAPSQHRCITASMQLTRTGCSAPPLPCSNSHCYCSAFSAHLPPQPARGPMPHLAYAMLQLEDCLVCWCAQVQDTVVQADVLTHTHQHLTLLSSTGNLSLQTHKQHTGRYTAVNCARLRTSAPTCMAPRAGAPQTAKTLRRVCMHQPDLPLGNDPSRTASVTVGSLAGINSWPNKQSKLKPNPWIQRTL